MHTKPYDISRDARLSTVETFLSEKALAVRWSVSVRTLQNNRIAGRGVPFVKIGRAVRYRLSDILHFENVSTRASTHDANKQENAG